MILEKLRSSNKINKELEILISQLSLEDLISIKLELILKSLNGKLCGFPIWKNINHIIKDALIKAAIKNTSSTKQAAALLNMRTTQIKQFILKYGLSNDFSNKTK